MNASPIMVTREALYEQAWTTPLLQLAKEYGVTATALSKTCRRLAVPVPPRGYWQKLSHGKRVNARPPLPPLQDGQRAAASIQPSNPLASEITADPIVAAALPAHPAPENRIKVADRLRDPHPVIREIIASSRAQPAQERETTTTTSQSSIRVLVRPALRSRALRLTDALLKAAEARGFSVSSKGVHVKGQVIPFAIEEKDERQLHVATARELADKKAHPWHRIPTWDAVPSGRLSIKIDEWIWWGRGHRKRWSDSRRGQLDDMLDDVLVGIVSIGAAMHQRAEELRQEEERRAEMERQRRELERQARMRAARSQDVVACSKAWESAEMVRRLASEVRRRAQAAGEDISPEVMQWLTTANQVADEIDPLARGLNDMLTQHENTVRAAGAESPSDRWR